METRVVKEGFLIRMGGVFTRVSQKYMPDPTIFAVVLTFIAFILAKILTELGPLQILDNWYKGFWELLMFSMQMAVVLITGGVVAASKQAQKVIRAIAGIPKTGPAAAALVTLISVITSFFHFGLSLVVSALIAKIVGQELYKKRAPFDYGLLAASAYLGQMTWCVGFSNSVGLTIATSGHFLQNEMGIIPLSRYIFNPMNITLAVSCLIILPIIAYMVHPKENTIIAIPDYALPYLQENDAPAEQRPQDKVKFGSVGDALNNSKIIGFAAGALGMIYIISAFIRKGFSALDLNLLNAVFFFGGILLHGNIARYVAAFGKSTSNAGGVIFQFPLYAGIMGIIRYSDLVGILAKAIAAVSTPFTFYLLTFISASIVNMFVPSGGGQWAVQGPIAVESAKIMGADLLKTAQAVAYGNSWTNMCQPFWALALLGITGLKAKDVMGYSTAVMLAAAILFFAVILFLPV